MPLHVSDSPSETMNPNTTLLRTDAQIASARARHKYGNLVSRSGPHMMTTRYQELSDREGGGAMDDALASIFVASGEGNRAALVMRQKSRYWKGLIDAAILAWLDVLITLVRKVHRSRPDCSGANQTVPPAGEEPTPPGLGHAPGSPMQLVYDAALQRHGAAKARHTFHEDARNNESVLRTYLRDAFGEDTSTRAMKWVHLAADTDPIRNTHAHAGTLRFHPGSVHTYIALAQWACQLHQWYTFHQRQLSGFFQGYGYW